MEKNKEIIQLISDILSLIERAHLAAVITIIQPDGTVISGTHGVTTGQAVQLLGELKEHLLGGKSQVTTDGFPIPKVDEKMVA